MNVINSNSSTNYYTFRYKFIKSNRSLNIGNFMNADVPVPCSIPRRILMENPIIENQGSETKEAEIQQN